MRTMIIHTSTKGVIFIAFPASVARDVTIPPRTGSESRSA